MAWNSWRERNPSIEPDLSEADLSETNLPEADLSGANLSEASLYFSAGRDYLVEKLPGANLHKANLSQATLLRANLFEADLSEANLSRARLLRADLSGANLSRANLSGANLSGANLTRSALVETNLTGTMLTGCSIYGISAWSLHLAGAIQHNLNVSPYGEPAVMVDNLEVAQFIYLLLNNESIRQVIDTITSKAVLILGRFTADRKRVLNAIRDELRQRGYLPILFDHRRYHGGEKHPPGATGHRPEPSVGTSPAVAANLRARIRHVRALLAIPLGARYVLLRQPR
jgi:hypothetical protein